MTIPPMFGKTYKLNIIGNLNVRYFLDEDINGWVAVCDELNLATQADTREEAQESFFELLGIYLRDIIERGTIEQELSKVRWNVEIINNNHLPVINITIPNEIVEKYNQNQINQYLAQDFCNG